MSEPATAPSGREMLRVLVARLNAEAVDDRGLPDRAERVRAAAEGARLSWRHDAEAGWWSLEVQAAGEPAPTEAKLTRLERGRWSLWLARDTADAGRLIAPCALAVEFVQALRAGSDAPDAVAAALTARTGAHVSLAAGRLSVTTADGRRCRGLVTAGADGLPSLYLLDGDAWAGAAGTVRTSQGLRPRDR